MVASELGDTYYGKVRRLPFQYFRCAMPIEKPNCSEGTSKGAHHDRNVPHAWCTFGCTATGELPINRQKPSSWSDTNCNFPSLTEMVVSWGFDTLLTRDRILLQHWCPHLFASSDPHRPAIARAEITARKTADDRYQPGGQSAVAFLHPHARGGCPRRRHNRLRGRRGLRGGGRAAAGAFIRPALNGIGW